MVKKKAVFIAATGQNVGKTTVCLGVIAGLLKRCGSVGFIKPVGQQHVEVEGGQRADKDAVLFRDHFDLTASYADMSPVLVPHGFTKEYLNGTVSSDELEKRIVKAFHTIAESNAYTVVEGTGHVGVGSIIGLNNAKVAATLGLDIVLIASGGLGSARDELALNVALCQKYDVTVRGVILNRVLARKRDMILEYFPKALSEWGIPLIGCIPYNEFLNTPCMKDFATLFKTPFLAGKCHRLRHFTDTRLVAGSLESYHDEVMPSQLIITPASREDIIQATLQRHDESLARDRKDLEGGIILTGRRPPSAGILKQIEDHDIPVLYAPHTSYDVMKAITSFIAKTANEDVRKVSQAIDLVETHVDFDALSHVSDG